MEKLLSVEFLVKIVLFYSDKVKLPPNSKDIQINVKLGGRINFKIVRDQIPDETGTNPKVKAFNDNTTYTLYAGQSAVIPISEADMKNLHKPHTSTFRLRGGTNDLYEQIEDYLEESEFCTQYFYKYDCLSITSCGQNNIRLRAGMDDANKDAPGTSKQNVVEGKQSKKHVQIEDPRSKQSIPTSKSSFKSFENMGRLDSKPERQVLVIYTGGTIGMIRNNDGVLAPLPHEMSHRIKKYAQLHDEEYALKKFGTNHETEYFVLPCSSEPCRVIYTVHEYDPLLDSSNMSVNEWVRIATDIQKNYEIYDGFVILHGTDTLTYTASALSFMLENLGKTIILTGSQIPLFETRSDGKDNFLSAVLFAGNYVIPEVTIFFGHRLYRGNRTIKKSSKSFHAFDSPNIAPLAHVGINIEIDYKSIFRPTTIEKFSVHTKLNENVGLLRLFPSITAATVRLFLQPPTQGVVLQSYGAGNIPSKRKDLLEALEDASARGIIIVNCTQCLEGSVQEIYETGHVLRKARVVSGVDMTPESALVKLSYVLSKDEWDLDTKREMMSKNIRGELTSEHLPEVYKWDLVNAVATALNLTAPEDVQQLNVVLCPALLIASIVEDDITKLRMLKSLGADLSMPNTDGRTCLHVAAALGRLEFIPYLLSQGCSVHIRDRLDKTPLQDAIENDHHNVIKMLIKCGAHLTRSTSLLGDELCLAAARGSKRRLKSYQLAGVNLSQVDSCGRTALHVAALHGHVDIAELLLGEGCSPTAEDLLGMTPIRIAEIRDQVEILKLFNDNSQQN